MRTHDQIFDDARPGRAFSNMTMFEIWAPRWCWAPCLHDDEEVERYCPILSVAVLGDVTPKEWITQTHPSDQVHGNFVCTEFQERPDDYDPQTPVGPQPQLPGQLPLFEERT